MALDLYQLKAFFAVAQTLNYTEASRRLYLTQSAVSHAVAKLARGVKDELFVRAGNKLALTETGALAAEKVCNAPTAEKAPRSAEATVPPTVPHWCGRMCSA